MIKPFVLVRETDVSGISGTGVVAEGVVFTDGTAILRWVTVFRSTAIYSSIEELKSVHGHDGKTRVEYYKIENEHYVAGSGTRRKEWS